MNNKVVFLIPPLVKIPQDDNEEWTPIIKNKDEIKKHPFTNDIFYLSAGYMAAILLENDIDVEIIDCSVDCLVINELKERIIVAKPDYVAIPLVVHGVINNAYR